ncbi:MAG: hypothetical protein AAFS12_17450 [Cyanobacteria bacterium J06632_19]
MTENGGINTGDGNYNEGIQGDYIQQSGNFGVGVNKGTINNINNLPQKEPFQPIKYLPKFRNPNFVGRQEKLGEIHHQLKAEKRFIYFSSTLV